MAINAVGGRCLKCANANPSNTSLAATYANAQRMRVSTPGLMTKDLAVGERRAATERTTKPKVNAAIGMRVTARDPIRQSFCSV